MKDRRVGAVLVTEAERLIGIFTARDAVCRVLANGKSPTETTLAEVMTKEPASLLAGCTAIEALRLMQNGGFRHVPVVQDGKLLGVVSKGDFSGLEYNRLEEETVLWERIG
jgi:CBS domain-containing protein